MRAHRTKIIKAKGFTLIELLLVITIISVLAAVVIRRVILVRSNCDLAGGEAAEAMRRQ